MPTVIAAIFLILIVGIGIELLVFRPLERAGAAGPRPDLVALASTVTSPTELCRAGVR